MSVEATVHLFWARVGDVPADDTWLTDEEAGVYGALRMPRRASDWRLGRWVAKGVVAAALDPQGTRPRDIEVLAAPGGAPRVRLADSMSTEQVRVSLSHCGGMGFAAATRHRLRLGCDVEAVEPRSDEFVADYFTEQETSWITGGEDVRDLRANLLWSAKESALKALGEGLRMDTRSVEVEAVAPPAADPEAWRALAVEVPGGESFPGLWRVLDGRVWTVVGDGALRIA